MTLRRPFRIIALSIAVALLGAAWALGVVAALPAVGEQLNKLARSMLRRLKWKRAAVLQPVD